MAIKNNYDMIHSFMYDSLDSYCSKSWINISYSRGRLFSYGTCIAQFVKDINDDLILIISDNNFSNTTAKHLSIVRAANPHYNVIYLPQAYGSSEFYAHEVLNRLVSALEYNSKKLSRQVNRYDFTHNYNMLSNFLQVKHFSPLFDKAKEVLEQYKVLYDACHNQEAINQIKKETRQANLEAKKKHKEELKQIKTYINEFINDKGYLAFIYELFINHKNIFNTGLVPSKVLEAFADNQNYSYCWIDGGYIKTSQRVTVPVNEAKILLHRYVNNKPILGHTVDNRFKVLAVTQDYIKIGCHILPIENINALIDALGIKQIKDIA